MIISKLKGGLGNQMFQYAAARVLSVKHNTRLKLDLSFFKDNNADRRRTQRKYELNVFQHQAVIASEFELMAYEKIAKFNVILKLKRIIPFLPIIQAFYEPHFHYSVEIEKVSNNTILDGYWQSEKYFAGFENLIRDDFLFSRSHDHQNKIFADEISSCNAVSIHVRRGDYISNPDVVLQHPVCDIGYYRKAIDVITGKVTSPVFYIFTDDYDWARENFLFNLPIKFINHNKGNKNFEDMWLMSLCKHHILANSSFSWWGAWLNADEDKIVIAPRIWFKDNSINTDDLIPEKWIRL